MPYGLAISVTGALIKFRTPDTPSAKHFGLFIECPAFPKMSWERRRLGGSFLMNAGENAGTPRENSGQVIGRARILSNVDYPAFWISMSGVLKLGKFNRVVENSTQQTRCGSRVNHSHRLDENEVLQPCADVP
jgi:hypothetical protein